MLLDVWHANTASRPSYMHCNIRPTHIVSHASYMHCNIQQHRHLQHSVSFIRMSASRGPGFQPRLRRGLTWDDLCSFPQTDATVLS